MRQSRVLIRRAEPEFGVFAGDKPGGKNVFQADLNGDAGVLFLWNTSGIGTRNREEFRRDSGRSSGLDSDLLFHSLVIGCRARHLNVAVLSQKAEEKSSLRAASNRQRGSADIFVRQ